MAEAVYAVLLSATTGAVTWLLIDRDRIAKTLNFQRQQNQYFQEQIRMLIEEVKEQKQILELATLDCAKLDGIDEQNIRNN